MFSRTTLAIAVTLLWAPSSRGFAPGAVSSTKVSTPNSVVPLAMTAAESNDSGFDWDSFDRKNASRKKFGLQPLNPEQYLENEAQIQQLSLQQDQKKAELQRQKAESTAQKAQQQNQQRSLVPGFLEKMLGSDTCESNFDCESPQVCCDFGFTRKCCSSGMRQRSYEGELAYVRVPVDIQDPYQF